MKDSILNVLTLHPKLEHILFVRSSLLQKGKKKIFYCANTLPQARRVPACYMNKKHPDKK